MAFYNLEDGSLAYWPDGQIPPWTQKYTAAQDPNAPGVSDNFIKNTLGGGFDGFSSSTGSYTGNYTGKNFDNAMFGEGPEFYSNLQDWRNQNSGAGFGAGSDWWRYYQENPTAAYNDLGDPSLYQWQNGIPYYKGSDGQWHAKNVTAGAGAQRDYFSNAPAYDPTKGSEYTGQDAAYYQGLAGKTQQQLADANQRLNGGQGGSSTGSGTQNPMSSNDWWKTNGFNKNANWGALNFGSGGQGGTGTGGWQPDGTFNPSGGASIYAGFNGQAGNGGAWQNSPIDFVAANQSYQMARKQGQLSPYYGSSGWQGNNNNASGSNYGTSPFATMQNNQKNNTWFQGLNTTQQIEAMKRANALKAQDVYAGKGLQGGYFKTVQDTWGQ